MGHLECFNFCLKILNWKITGFVNLSNCSVNLNVKQIYFAFTAANNVSRVVSTILLSGFRVTAVAQGQMLQVFKTTVVKDRNNFFGR